MELDASRINKDKDAGLKTTLLSINNWIRYLLSKWKIIVVAIILGAATGEAIGLFTPKKYEAKATLMVNTNDQKDTIVSSGGRFTVMIDNSEEENPFSERSIIWLFTSDKIIQETLLTPVKNASGKETCLLNWFIQTDKKTKKVEESAKKRNQNFKGFLDTLTLKNQLTDEQKVVLKFATSRIKKDFLSATRVPYTTGIIGLKLVSSDESFAAIFVDTIIKRVNEFYLNVQNQNLKNSETRSEKEPPIVTVIDRPALPLSVLKPSHIKMALFFSIGFLLLMSVFLIIKEGFRNALSDVKRNSNFR